MKHLEAHPNGGVVTGTDCPNCHKPVAMAYLPESLAKDTNAWFHVDTGLVFCDGSINATVARPSGMVS